MDELNNFINEIKSHFDNEDTSEELREYDLNILEKLDDINKKYQTYVDDNKVAKEEYDKIVAERDEFKKKYINRFGEKSTSKELTKKSFDDIINDNIRI